MIEVASLNVPPYSNGWNNKEPTVNSRGDQRDLNHNEKHSAGVVFFNCKCFRGSGCSKDVIKRLRAHIFNRPSNIQVSVNLVGSCQIVEFIETFMNYQFIYLEVGTQTATNLKGQAILSH